jgi:hypothetical protein
MRPGMFPLDRFNRVNKKLDLSICPIYEFYPQDTGENIENIYKKLYHYNLKNFKIKIISCHENNWLFKILFYDYLDGETEYKKLYQNTKKNTVHICVK